MPDNAPAALEAHAIHKAYATRGGPLAVLQDISLELAAGQAVAIMGPSGAGKSTLLSILGTLEPPDSGELNIAQVQPFALNPRELARFRNRNIGFVFQDHHLLPQLSLLENVLLPTLADGHRRRSSDPNQRALELLDKLGLAARAAHLPAELSGGERQRGAIARALMNRPALVLADEPTGNLDRKTASLIGDLLVELPTQQNIALVLVTHSQLLAERFARRVELLDGRLVPA